MTDCPADELPITIRLSWLGGGGPLDIADHSTGAPCLWWNQFSEPGFAMRYTTAPPSAWVPGSVLLAAVPDAATIPLQVVAQGTSTSELGALKAGLAAALGHWEYTVAVLVDGVQTGVWDAQPTIPVWGPMTPTTAGLYVAQAVCTIPVNPTGAP